MSLRDQIETEKKAREQEISKAKLEEAQGQKEDYLKKQESAEKKFSQIADAHSYFDRVILPIFQEISDIKDVSMREIPYRQPNEVQKYFGDPPIRNGFFSQEVWNGETAYIIGTLIWDLDLYSRTDEVTWQYLSLGISDKGETMGHDVPKIQVINSNRTPKQTGISKLEKWLAVLIGRNNGFNGNVKLPDQGPVWSDGL